MGNKCSKNFFKKTIDKSKKLWYNLYRKLRKRENKMKKFIDYFELNNKYKFELSDLTALVFLVCAILGIFTTINITPLFLLGAILGTVFCWRAKRLNLVVLNVALLVLNLVNFIKMF